MTLELSIAEQLWCCLASLIFGVLAGILYDVFRIFYMCVGVRSVDLKNGLKHFCGATAVFVFDLLYCAIITVAFAVLMYAFSYGRFRLVFLFCSAAGFGAYILTIGRIVVFLSEKVVSALKKVVCFIIRCVCVPFSLAFKAIAWLLRVLYNKTLGVCISQMSLRRDKIHLERIIKEKINDFVKL